MSRSSSRSRRIASVDDLSPCPYNPRTITDKAFGGLEKSLTEFGDLSGIVWNARTGQLVAGHQRLRALREMHGNRLEFRDGCVVTPEGEWFRVRVVNWEKMKADAAMVAANNENIAGDWTDGLTSILDGIAAEFGSLFEQLNFDQLAVDLGIGETDTDAAEGSDDIPEPPDEPQTKAGDIWVLGNHRLMCGDSAKPEDVDKLVARVLIDLINTDPPYNVKVEPRSHNAVAAARALGNKNVFHHQGMDEAIHGRSQATHKKLRPKDRALANDFVSDEDFEQMLDAWFGNAARVLKPGGAFYIWGGYANIGNYPPPMKRAGLYFSQGIVWDKEHPVLTRKDMLGAFELCFYGWKEGAGHNWYGPNNVQDIWRVKKVTQSKMVHLTEKPVGLALRAIRYSTLPGQSVLDLFGGSGSTLIAAEQSGRRACLMELDALYCDVIVKRWERFTGKEANRE